MTFSLENANYARLALYSVTGREERVLADGAFPAGPSEVAWDGRNARGESLAPGVDFLRLDVRRRQLVRKIVASR